MLTSPDTVAATGIDAAALKPTECDVTVATELSVDTVAIDYEGRDHLPDPATLARLAEETDLYVTTPVRADGFDPLGDDSIAERLPASVDRVLVAGHSAYLTETEASRAVAPRLGAAVERATDPWVGTEGIERIAMAAGGTQYELLSARTETAVRGLRAAGFDGDIAVYAPTVLADDGDTVLDAVGDYVARRGPVRRALPDGAATDAGATGRTREILLDAATDYALVGTPEDVGERVDRLRELGVTTVVAYPARGVEDLR